MKYKLETYVDDQGLSIDVYKDIETGQPVKYLSMIEIITPQGPDLVRVEFKDCSSLDEAFTKRTNHYNKFMAAIEEIQNEQLKKQGKKIITPQDLNGGNKLIVP